MTARYLVRFDDVCPTMNWRIWERVERLLVERRIRPLVSVVPANRDPRLVVEEPRPDFWERVRSWQARGWTIGVHGYEHRYVTTHRAKFAWDPRSEFAGLPYAEQERKVKDALAVFRSEHVRPDVWVAPNHSFDDATLDALRRNGVRMVCDGLALYPFLDARGLMWIPQQLWGFRPRRFGVWTVCLHHNDWSDADVEALGAALERYADRITDVRSIRDAYSWRRRGIRDRLFVGQRRLVKRVRSRVGGAGRIRPAGG